MLTGECLGVTDPEVSCAKTVLYSVIKRTVKSTDYPMAVMTRNRSRAKVKFLGG